MKVLVAVLGCAVLANGFIAWRIHGQQEEHLRVSTDLAARLEGIDARLAELANRPVPTKPSRPPSSPGPTLRGTPKPVVSESASPARKVDDPTPRAEPAPSRSARARTTTSSRDETSRANKAQSDVLQIADGAKRQDGMRELVTMLRSDNAATAWAALRALPKLRGVELDTGTLRPLLERHLESGQGGMRVSAAYALNNVASDPDTDVPRYIALARADPEAAFGLAGAAMFSAGGKIDGELATLFAELIRNKDVEKARSAANYLRSRTTTLEVHEAVADAWRRNQAAGGRRGLWFHILGQMQPMHRPILEVIFEILGSPEAAREGGLLTGRVVRQTLPEDRPFAADKAAEALVKSTEPRVRLAILRILAEIGTADHLAVVREFASNELVPAPERDQANKVAEQLSRR